MGNDRKVTDTRGICHGAGLLASRPGSAKAGRRRRRPGRGGTSMAIVAAKLAAVKGSQTRAITQLANEMKAQGRKVIALTQGEPDFPTPPNVIEAATRAMHAGHTRYTPTAGVPELR